MADLQQRTPAWHIARRGKLTASNLGAALGQVSYTSRQVAYQRALGLDKFQGNEACQWGNDNEMNGIAGYQAFTGNLVNATGLHIHPHYKWLAGSPDGFVYILHVIMCARAAIAGTRGIDIPHAALVPLVDVHATPAPTYEAA